MSKIERRRTPRVRIGKNYIAINGDMFGIILDFASGGMAVESHSILHEDSITTLNILEKNIGKMIEELSCLCIHSTVLSTSPFAPYFRFRHALKFVGPSSGQQNQIRQIVHQATT